MSTPGEGGESATAGGLVFTGDALAFDAKTGKVLWRHATGNAIGGGVVTYMAGGRQHVAVAAGMKAPLWPVPVTSSRVVVYSFP